MQPAPCALAVVEEKKEGWFRGAWGGSWDDLRVDLPLIFLDLARVVFRSVLLLLLHWVTTYVSPRGPADYGLGALRHYYSQDDSFTPTGCRNGWASCLITNTVDQDCLSRSQGGLAMKGSYWCNLKC
jgi:hypothetical protein